MLLPLLVLTATSAPAWHGAFGAQIDGDPHGVLNAGVRSGAWSAELITDTLELRYADEGDGCRVTVAARGELFASGLMISPWTNGAKDPARALFAHHGGLEAEYAHYLPRGFYVALAGAARIYAFGATADTVGPAPDAELVAGPTLRAGWWSADAAAVIEGGFDVLAAAETTVSPRGGAQLRIEPAWSLGPIELGPWFEGRAGVAERQDRITLTRVGGSNPYVVPIAGAAWAEWWAEDYLALRAGARVSSEHAWLAVVLDAAVFTAPLDPDPDREAWGLGVLAGLKFPPYFVNVAAGWAPRIPRQDGVPRFSGWVLIGADWTEF